MMRSPIGPRISIGKQMRPLTITMTPVLPE